MLLRAQVCPLPLHHESPAHEPPPSSASKRISHPSQTIPHFSIAQLQHPFKVTLIPSSVLAQIKHLRRNPVPDHGVRKHLGPMERALGAPSTSTAHLRASAVRLYEFADKGVPVGRWR